ncbi:MAG: valine--tRNA ligase [Candidatus Paceibacterota bacterium]
MSQELPKTYSPSETEERIYKLWLDSGYFSPENLPGERKEKFVSAIAPPNITGELHMGHALEVTLQDILIRMKRMQGYKTLWLPGLDHAGIAAQNKVEKQLAKEGLSRHDLGREKFIKRVQEWKEQYGGAILNQFKRIGISVDWSRLRYTMDEDYQKAVEYAFLKYHERGWIYQGERVINWCIRCSTSISDLEVNYVPEKAKLYYIKYGPFTLATVRPETKLGDTALAVHPDDERYKKYVGADLEVDSVDNSTPREEPPQIKKVKLKVVADESVDPEFGTGIIKVTPAHDLTDSEIGKRHDLPSVTIIDRHGKMNGNAGVRYEGMKTTHARELISKDLEELGLMEKVEDYDHNIGRCDRCNSVIEPLPSEQWFLKMNELAKLAIEAVAEKEVVLNPQRWEEPYLSWLKNIKDWNISRQLWWGHRLPVWFHEPKCIPRPGHEKEIEKCEEKKISTTKPTCKYCDAKYTQSGDVLDTWFSSALWPFATLGWPNEASKDLNEYYPTDFITSDRGILFLWQVRMIFSGKFFTKKAPFKNIFIHPTVLTKDGKRMSKSLGTGIDPLLLTEKYGTDALRFGLSYQTTGVQDMRFNEDVILMGKKFANKLWNIARYVLIKVGSDYRFEVDKTPKSTDKIVTKMAEVSSLISNNIEEYKFGEAAHLLYDFVWHDIADKYIEETKDKDDKNTHDTLAYLLVTSLKLLHPFMPFVTEEIWSKLPTNTERELLVISKWPS